MGKTTKLTKAVLVAMGATGTTAVGAATLESGDMLELPAMDSSEYAVAAAGNATDAAFTTAQTKKKTKKKKAGKKAKCRTPGGNTIIIPFHPQTGGCPPGLIKKKKVKKKV
jgi:hypothetical protein